MTREHAEKEIKTRLEEIRVIGRQLAESLGIEEQRLNILTSELYLSCFSIVSGSEKFMINMTYDVEDGRYIDHTCLFFEKGDERIEEV